MNWLVAGLGNPGQRYDNTRHNAGFAVVDFLAGKEGFSWKEQEKFQGMVAGDRELKLLKPETYMNASGESVKKMTDYYKIPLGNIVVIHDDLDLVLGQAKVAWARGPHIHNGILSVEQYLGTKEFWRVRVGVDNRDSEERRIISGERYVLKPLLYEEKKVLDKGIIQAAEIVGDILGGRYAVNR